MFREKVVLGLLLFLKSHTSLRKPLLHLGVKPVPFTTTQEAPNSRRPQVLKYLRSFQPQEKSVLDVLACSPS